MLDNMTLAEHQDTVREIEPAVCKLHAYWLSQRTDSFSGDEAWGNTWADNQAESINTVSTVIRESPKVGRNDPCPCGSGKKFKKCCLH